MLIMYHTSTMQVNSPELQIVFRYHGPNDPGLCKMMGQFSKGWVSDNLKWTVTTSLRLPVLYMLHACQNWDLRSYLGLKIEKVLVLVHLQY